MSSLSILSDAELRFYFDNVSKRKAAATMKLIVDEMRRRGLRCTKQSRAFEWNRQSVRDALEPFVTVSMEVRGNQRTAYACGGRVFSKDNGAGKIWIDAYSAIKCGNVNATFSAHVAQPGMEPTFTLTDNDFARTFKPHELAQALDVWGRVAERAAVDNAQASKSLGEFASRSWKNQHAVVI